MITDGTVGEATSLGRGAVGVSCSGDFDILSLICCSLKLFFENLKFNFEML